MALLLFVLLFALYVLNFRVLAAGDSLPTRVLPFSLLREGDLDLDEFTWRRRADGRLPYYVHDTGHGLYSVSTVATAFVITPLYVLPTWWLATANVDYDDVRARVVAAAMERISAAALTALSASVLFLALCRVATWQPALLLALLYGLGTSTWSIASQALWPHALAELCLAVLCLVLLAPRPTRPALAVAGLAAALAVANRPQAIIFAALATAFVAYRQRRDLPAFLVVPALVGVAMALYNQAIFRTLAGGYGGLQHFDAPIVAGVAGLLVSPNRGLLVFTPVMAFALWGAVRVWRVPAPPWMRWLTIGVALYVVVHGAFREWWAGYCFGPRYFTDVLPALTLFLVYGLVPYWHQPVLRAVAVVLAAWSVAVQAIGVYAADDRWNREPVPIERAPARIWDWGDLQIARALGNGWQGGALAPVMLDAFTDLHPARVAALEPAQLAAQLRVLRAPQRVRAGRRARLRVAVTNRSAVAWPAFNGEGAMGARHLVFLMARWVRDGQQVPGVGDVVLLPENLGPGETTRVRLPLVAPAAPGRYDIEVRVTQAVDGASGIVGPGALTVPVQVVPRVTPAAPGRAPGRP